VAVSAILTAFASPASLALPAGPSQPPETSLWTRTFTQTKEAFVSIPEPGAWISLIGGGAVLMGIQRFRRRA